MKHPVSRLLLALLFITAALRAAPPGVTVSRRVEHGREVFVITNVSAGAQAFLNLGDAEYLKALENAWRFLEPQRYASGGWAPEEQSVHPGRGRLAASLRSSRAHFETPCGSFADMKLARYLLRFTGRPLVRRRTSRGSPCANRATDTSP